MELLVDNVSFSVMLSIKYLMWPFVSLRSGSFHFTRNEVEVFKSIESMVGEEDGAMIVLNNKFSETKMLQSQVYV